MEQYKKEKLIETKLFISQKFTISKIHKNFTICVTRMRYEDQTHMHNVPQPTSSTWNMLLIKRIAYDYIDRKNSSPGFTFTILQISVAYNYNHSERCETTVLQAP